MMVFSAFKQGMNVFFKRKSNLLWAIIPVFMGIFLYFALGAWAINMFQLLAADIIKLNLMNVWIKGITFFSIGILVGAILYFLIHWFFLICVFFLSYPFHRLICGNTEREMGISLPVGGFTLKSLVSDFGKVLLNLFLSFCVICFAFFPIFAPMALVCSALLVSLQFIDYTWSRNNLSFTECFKDLRLNFLNYLGMGLIGLFLMAIPFINLMFMPVLVSVYAVLFYKQRGQA